MTRDQCIERMARAIDPDAWDENAKAYGKDARRKASLVVAADAYDAMAEHIQAREEAVREMCARSIDAVRNEILRDVNSFPGSAVELAQSVEIFNCIAMSIRALDIGGKTDG